MDQEFKLATACKHVHFVSFLFLYGVQHDLFV